MADAAIIICSTKVILSKHDILEDMSCRIWPFLSRKGMIANKLYSATHDISVHAMGAHDTTIHDNNVSFKVW